MAQVLQLRRGTTAQNDAFTGAVAEVSVDTDRKSLRVHDGVTMGGKEIADLQTAVPLLPAASSVSGSDTVPVIQSGVARKATKTQILNGIVNANIDAGAAIAATKLASDSITNTQIKSDAAIAGTKIAPDFGAQNIRLNDNQYVLWGGNTNGINGNNASNFLAVYTAAAERMRIDAGGSLLVGTTVVPTTGNVNGTAIEAAYLGDKCSLISAESSNTNSYRIVFLNSNGLVGSITTSGSGTAYNTSSDYRLKENETPLTGGLSTVSQLNPVSFKWKADGSTGRGFIAHELQAVVPEAVFGEKDAVDSDGKPQYQGVDASKLVPYLVAAVQELSARVEVLEAAQ